MESIDLKTCLQIIEEEKRTREMPINEGSRRAKRVLMSPMFLFKLITEGNVVEESRCIKGLPPGARFVGSYFDHERFLAYLVFEHETFPEVPMGTPLPEVNVAIEAVRGAS